MEDDEVVYGDSRYQGADKIENGKSSTRARVEHQFLIEKNSSDTAKLCIGNSQEFEQFNILS